MTAADRTPLVPPALASTLLGPPPPPSEPGIRFDGGTYRARSPKPRVALVYIAGPFSGEDGWQVAENVHRAEVLAREVARLRAMPMTPHSIGARMNGTETYDFWCDATMEMMLRCDAVIFTHDWERSRGARGEMAEARRVKMPVFVDTYPTAAGLRDLKKWLDAWRGGL